jgi:hypothetical protein
MHVAVIKGRKAYVKHVINYQVAVLGGPWVINDEDSTQVLVGYTSTMKGGEWFKDRRYHISFKTQEEAVAYAQKYDDSNAQTSEEREAALKEAGW